MSMSYSKMKEYISIKQDGEKLILSLTDYGKRHWFKLYDYRKNHSDLNVWKHFTWNVFGEDYKIVDLTNAEILERGFGIGWKINETARYKTIDLNKGGKIFWVPCSYDDDPLSSFIDKWQLVLWEYKG